MIITVTFNPAIDYVVHLDRLVPASINRARSEEMFFGGKGINVSLILSELGVISTACGFVAGFTGEAIEKGLKNKGILTDFVHLKEGQSRINVKLRAGEETDINGAGPAIPGRAVEELCFCLDCLKDQDTLVLAGSIPSSLPGDTYERILKRLSNDPERRIRFVVDAAGDLLMKTLPYHPFLIKPNHVELGEIFQRDLTDKEEIIDCAKALQGMGAENVLVSMAERGALLVDKEGGIHEREAVRGSLVNSVGAGDSMVAGFLAALEKNRGSLDFSAYEEALLLGTAAGGATAFSEGLADRTLIDQMRMRLERKESE